MTTAGRFSLKSGRGNVTCHIDEWLGTCSLDSSTSLSKRLLRTDCASKYISLAENNPMLSRQVLALIIKVVSR